jgi:hypothetical protein
LKIPKFYIILVAISILIFIVVEMLRDRPVSWEATFSSRETMPYGTYAFYKLMPGLFPGKTIRKNFGNYGKMFEEEGIGDEILLIVNSEFYTDEYSIKDILSYVDKGHQVFISAFQFDDFLMDTLEVSTFSKYNGIGRGSDVHFVFSDSLLNEDSAFTYKFALYSYFVENDTAEYEVLGRFENGKPNFLRFNIGNGELYLNTVPLVFANYNILKGNTRTYVEKLFSMLDVNDIIWDEYVRHIEIESTSPFRYILSVPSLRYAFLVLLLLTLLYLVYAGKRRQQMIPVVVPFENSTHRFIKTLGRLYLYRNNHKDIALKKIRYFQESVQTRYSMKIKKFDKDFVKRFSQKSGTSEELVTRLVSLIQTVESKESINESELFELNKLVDKCME